MNRICILSLLTLIVVLPLEAQYYTGCILNEEDYQKVPLAAPLMRGDFGKLPKQVSFRKYAPTPRNQGTYGTCVGWSTAYAGRTILMAMQEGWSHKMALVTQNAFSPFFTYACAKSNTDEDCLEGTSLYNALEVIKEVGALKYSEFASQCGQQVTYHDEKKAEKYKINDYRRLFETNSAYKIELTKKSLSENRPVVVGIQCCTESFLNAKGIVFWEAQPTDNLNPEGGHAVTIIGYDDAKFGGAFEIMNSWGTEWGEQGFIWMKYADFDRYCFEAYEMSIQLAEEKTFEGKLSFILSAGDKMKANLKEDYYYEMKEAYESGTLYRLQISNNEPAYVYAFASDLSKENYQVFPHDNNISPFLAYQGNNVAIPSEEKYIQMDDRKGMDYFCVLYSAEKLDIELLLKQIEQAEGNFKERLEAVLGDRMLNSEEVKYNHKGEISFKGKSKDKTIVPVVVAIGHI